MTTGMLGEDQGLLTRQDAADLLQVAVDAASLAAEGHWPPCREISRLVRYRKAAVQRWVTGSLQAGSPNQNRWQRVFSEALC
jgi:hypothetical protein